MPPRLRPLAVAAACWLLVAHAAAAERMRSFEAEIHVMRNDRFTVEERIVWDFGAERHHGIFRELPVAYGRGRAADYHVAVDVLAVTDGEGHELPYKVSEDARNLRIRIGDPHRTVSGVREYRLRYRVRRGLLYFEDHDELYWNVTGDQWPVGIGSARAQVFLPDRGAAGVRTACFTGPRGSMESACRARVTDAGVEVEATGPLGPREGLTLVVGVPKGMLVEPSRWSRLWDRLLDYGSPWLLLPLLVLAGMTWLWRSHGRDPGASAAIPVRYEPPEGLSPAEVGTLVDERADLADVTATILDLAVRGHLRIEEVETERLLFLKDRDYRLVKRHGGNALRPHEQTLYAALFEDGSSVLISSLRNRFRSRLERVRESLYDSLSKDGGFFPTSPERVRLGWGLAGAGVLAVGMAAIAGSARPATIAAVVATGLVVLAFSRVMPRRTLRGRRAYEQILGFKEFLEKVDRDRLEREGTRNPQHFERLLPFAVVLGVADAWADAFADLYTQPPSWWVGSTPGVFQPRAFVADVGRSLDTIGQTLASAPASSGSGSSGFSSGGGFSGGGFGGGGGGSW